MVRGLPDGGMTVTVMSTGERWHELGRDHDDRRQQKLQDMVVPAHPK